MVLLGLLACKESLGLLIQKMKTRSFSTHLHASSAQDFAKILRRLSFVGAAVTFSTAEVKIQNPDSINPQIFHVGSRSARASDIPALGVIAPEFSLPSNYGKALSLNDFPGKRIILYFYPVVLFILIYAIIIIITSINMLTFTKFKGDFTQGCTIEAQGFQKDIAKYKELGAQIVGVSVDSVDKHLDFGKTYNLDFPLLSDQGGVVSGKYGSLLDFGFLGKFSNRQTYIISPDTHKIEFVFTDVEGRVAQHSEDVLVKLKELTK